MAQKKTSGNGQSGDKKKWGRRGDGLGTGPVGHGGRTEGTHATGSGVYKPTGERKESGYGRPAGGNAGRPSGGGYGRPSGGQGNSSGDRGILTDLLTGGSSSSSSNTGTGSGMPFSIWVIRTRGISLHVTSPWRIFL